MSDQYFASKPSSEPRERTIPVVLAGREVLVTTASGVFSPSRLDMGTSVLLSTAPPPPHEGALLDLGCGWGPIALSLALQAPQASVYAVDVNERALGLTRQNSAAVGATNVSAALPGDVPVEVQFEGIWSNPPIHVGKDALHEILTTWIPRLVPGGSAWLVVQKHLGSDSLLRWLRETFEPEYSVERATSKKTFRIIQVTRRVGAD